MESGVGGAVAWEHGHGHGGGLRVPFLIRWPQKIQAGRASDEIVHLVDMFPTFAAIAGGAMPTDRAMDGVNQLSFLLGKQEKSNRDFFPIFDFNGQLMGAKWRNWKYHAYQKVFGEDVPVAKAMLVNLYVDPLEERDTTLENTWLAVPVFERIQRFQDTLTKYPSVKPNTPDP